MLSVRDVSAASSKLGIGTRTGPRVEHWRHRTFGPASETPYRRRASDWIRLVIAVVVLAVLVAREGDLSTFEQNLVTFLNGLPSGSRPFFSFFYQLGAVWAVGVVLVAVLVARRWHLARDLTIAAALAWFSARVTAALIVQGGSLTKGLALVTRFGGGTPQFPFTRLAVIVAVIATASPYLTRPSRRLGQAILLLMAFAAMYLGTGLPNGILGAVVLGWGVAAGTHLAFGSPGGRPTRAQVAAALDELGVVVTDIQLAPHQTPGATVMLARDAYGPLSVRVFGRDEADAQLLAKFWRALLYKDGGPRLRLTRIEEVEHEGYTLLLATQAGARVPSVVVAGTAGPGAALIVTRPPAGPLLGETDSMEVADSTLDALWQQVAHLRSARVAHRHLNAGHVVLASDGPTIVDFGDASSVATSAQQAVDVTELLYSTATLVGDDRAVAAAIRGVGKDALVTSIPLLQPAALSSELRPRRRSEKQELKGRLTTLRNAAANATEVEQPQVQDLYRVNPQSLVMAVGTLVAVFALLSKIGDPQQLSYTLHKANVGWLVVALVISFLTNVATAIALMGTEPIALPLARTAELQLSMSFSNLAVPAVGGMAAQIRFLQKQGADLASAVASGGFLANVGNVAAQLLLIAVAIVLSPTTIDTGKIDTSSLEATVLLLTLVVFVASGFIFGVRRIRDKLLPPIKSAAATVWEALRSPRRVFLLFSGNIVNAIMYAFVLDACIAAFNGSIDFWTLLSINIFVGTIASLVPIPGGSIAVSSVGLSGALTAAGVRTEVAVAAVFAYQLVIAFIPAVPGWFATKHLLRDGYL